MRLITLEQASRYLRRDTTDDDEDLLEMIEAASELVVNYLGHSAESLFLDSEGQLPADSNGDPDVEIPRAVQGATKWLVAWMYRYRDADPDKAFQQGYLPAPVTAMLYPLRDPVFK